MAQNDSKTLRKINELRSQLSNEATNVLLTNLIDTKDAYKHKRNWTPAENIALRVFFGRVHPDEICEAFMCSYSSMMQQCIVLGLADLSEGRLLSAEDVELFVKLLNSKNPDTDNFYTPKYLCDLFEFDYDEQYEFKTYSVDQSDKIYELKQENMFDDID